jgi:hypothetical protein
MVSDPTLSHSAIDVLEFSFNSVVIVHPVTLARLMKLIVVLITSSSSQEGIGIVNGAVK